MPAQAEIVVLFRTRVLKADGRLHASAARRHLDWNRGLGGSPLRDTKAALQRPDRTGNRHRTVLHDPLTAIAVSDADRRVIRRRRDAHSRRAARSAVGARPAALTTSRVVPALASVALRRARRACIAANRASTSAQRRLEDLNRTRVGRPARRGPVRILYARRP